MAGSSALSRTLLFFFFKRLSIVFAIICVLYLLIFLTGNRLLRHTSLCEGGCVQKIQWLQKAGKQTKQFHQAALVQQVNHQKFHNKSNPFLAKSCEDVQSDRLAIIERECSKVSSTEAQMIAWARRSLSIVLEKEKALYCFVPKVGCSSWKIKILTERGVLKPEDYHGKDTFQHDDAMQNVLAKYKIKTLSRYKPQEARKILTTYDKFLFVRDPYERLVSGFVDKLVIHKDGYYRQYAKQLIRKSQNKSSDIPEFSDFLEDYMKGKGMATDIHWVRLTDLCKPCLIKYDFIGKMESVLQDTKCLLPKLGMSPWFPLPTTSRESKDKVTEYYSGIKRSTLERITRYIRNDLVMFGYKNLSERGRM